MQARWVDRGHFAPGDCVAQRAGKLAHRAAAGAFQIIPLAPAQRRDEKQGQAGHRAPDFEAGQTAAGGADALLAEIELFAAGRNAHDKEHVENLVLVWNFG